MTWSSASGKTARDGRQHGDQNYPPNPLQGHCRALVNTFAETQPANPALWLHETTPSFAKTVHFGQIAATEGAVSSAQKKQ
jgi:hypothetical protein